MNKKILALALPFLAANISIPLLGLVDTAVLGHLESEKYLGAIALGGMIFNFLFWGFSFLKMGTTGFTAQAKGRSDNEEVSLVLNRGLITGLFIGILIVLFQKPLWSFAAIFIDGSPEVVGYAQEYFYYRVWSAPAVMVLYVLSGWFLGVQNAVFVLYITLIENLANIAFNLLFIFVFGMRADGVALGTVCAQYLAVSVALVLLFTSYRHQIRKQRLKVVLKIRDLMSFFKVNANIMIRTLALMFAFAFFTVRSSSFDDVLLASNMILMQFMIFFAYVVDGLAHAGESLSGLFYGARKHIALKLLIRRLFIWSFGLAVIFSLLYFSLFRQMLGLLTDQTIVIQSAGNFKWWLVMIPLLSFAAFVWDGIYIGLTASAPLRNAMLLALFVVYFPAYYLTADVLGNHALWLAMSLFMLSRGLFLWVFSPSLLKMK